MDVITTEKYKNIFTIRTLTRFLFLSLKNDVASPKFPILPVRPILNKHCKIVGIL